MNLKNLPNLHLSRPLVCLDTETTGTDPQTDRVIELAFVVLQPNGDRIPYRWLIDPGQPIPPGASKIHGITDADVVGRSTFATVAAEATPLLTGVDLAGYNLRAFDIPILRAEFARAGLPWPAEDAHVVDAMAIFREREPHSLESAVRNYCGRPHVGAHGAPADAEATPDVLLAQLARYEDLPREMAALDAASGGRRPDWATEDGKIRWDADGHAVLAFSKYTGRRLVDLVNSPDGKGFLGWMRTKGDFAPDVRRIVSKAFFGGTPRRTDATAPASQGEAFDREGV